MLLALIVYNIYFHPLSSYPGPKACAATRIPYFRYLLGGGLVRQVAKWHEQYGEVVRIAPDELSYTSSTAWRDIYGSRQGHAQNPKDPRFYSAPVSNSSDEVVSENGDPSRYRRSLAHAFSESPVREQEPIIQGYVDLLIERLHGKIGMGARPVDMVAWYSFTTFDIIRDLTFGESFGCLRNSRYHDWISMIFKQIRVGVYVNVMKRMPGGQVLLRIISKFIASPKENRTVLTAEAAQNHLKNGSERLDYLSHILKQKEPSRQLTVPEIIANSNAFIIAGSETTATALSGVTYYLLSETRVMKKLVEEVRGAFSTEGDITISSVSKLPYILAVVNEGLRMYPPVPIGLPRVVKGKGIVVDGKWVPGKVFSTHLLARCRMEATFLTRSRQLLPFPRCRRIVPP